MVESDSKTERKITGYLRYILACVAVLIVVGLWYWHSLQPKRTHRKHSDTAAKEFEYLARRIDFDFPADSWFTWFTAKEARQDLDELEWLLENRYSYLKRKGVDYRAALDSIRSSLGEDIGRGNLALQLMKFIALFGDGHSAVGDPGLKRMCPGFLPFLVAEVDGRLLAFKADRSGFVDDKYPYLRRIDGVNISIWLDAASQTVAKGSPQFMRLRTVRNLCYIQYLRKELGLESSNIVRVELESSDGQGKRTLELAVVAEFPKYGPWPRTESRILSGNIGYLRIPLRMSNEQQFLDELAAHMVKFRYTKGLIIDIRGIGGGSRAPLRMLFPFFMADDDPPLVLNIAAHRLGHRKGLLDARWLYPAGWAYWTPSEREAIEQAARKFEPEWKPPIDEFSKWYYFVIKPNRQEGTYYYDRPVIILMSTTNFSASDIFLGAFKGHKNITLMGTASGGGSGRYQNYRLHHSLIRISLSSMASFQPNGKLYDGNGIQPDIIIEPVPTDFIGKTDTILNAAISWLL